MILASRILIMHRKLESRYKERERKIKLYKIVGLNYRIIKL